MPEWSDLSDDELEARMVQRGTSAEQARILVRERDRIGDEALTDWLGEP